ncbi:hypothetical protein [Amycolatopsis australiensis]|uniref:Uncharacterized protein n=1 Tax=Amycolatopsis australiensis TaxID=546364 RepID=A0A1K1LQC3_9PSEU|nr:hypothetical protein [Amycolatopsis australiensis]SFW13043.1 hypothetical protein SAMN04489730_0132 [Amycolatopsis australiensis]
MATYQRPKFEVLHEGEFARHVRPSRADDELIIDLVEAIFAPRPPLEPCDLGLVRQLVDRAPQPENIGVDDWNRPLRADEIAEIWGAPMEGPDTREQWLARADEVARAWGRPLLGPDGLLAELGRSDDDADSALVLRFATLAVEDPPAAHEQLTDWIGREPSPVGEERLRRLAHVAPRLLADALAEVEGLEPIGMVGPGAHVPPATAELAAMLAVAWHMAGDPAAADALVDAFAVQHDGVAGLGAIGFAALHLLASELRERREAR